MPLAGKRAKQSKTAAPGSSATSKLPSAATSKPGVKATSGKSSASAASAAAKCAVCEQDIVDGKDQALFCEGLCQGWFHRYCAGVSILHFDALSSSSEPFQCAGCFQKHCTTEIANLKTTISSLRAEVAELRETLDGVGSATINQRSSSNDDWASQRGVKSGVRGGRERGGRGRGVRGGRVGNRKERQEKKTGEDRLGEVVEEVISVGGSGGDRTEGTSSASQKKSAEKVRVQGARRVWGTLKLTTPSSLKSAISKFCPATSIQIKRKTVCDNVGEVKKWWFVIHAPEEVLVELDCEWEQLKLQTGWKLEPCFKPTSHTIPVDSSSPCPTQQHTSASTGGSHNQSISHKPNLCVNDGQSLPHTPLRSTPFLEK